MQAQFAVDWEILNGSATFGYKSILDKHTGTKITGLTVIDGAGNTLTHTTYENSGGYTILKFWFAEELSEGDSAVVIASYLIKKAMTCKSGKEQFHFDWANYWRCDVAHITYSFTLFPNGNNDDDYESRRSLRSRRRLQSCGSYTLAVSPDTSESAYPAATTDEISCDEYMLSQRYSEDDLDIGTSPQESYFTIDPTFTDVCDDEEEGLSLGEMIGIWTAAVFIVVFLGIGFGFLRHRISARPEMGPSDGVAMIQRGQPPVATATHAPAPPIAEAIVVKDFAVPEDGTRNDPVATEYSAGYDPNTNH